MHCYGWCIPLLTQTQEIEKAASPSHYISTQITQQSFASLLVFQGAFIQITGRNNVYSAETVMMYVKRLHLATMLAQWIGDLLLYPFHCKMDCALIRPFGGSKWTLGFISLFLESHHIFKSNHWYLLLNSRNKLQLPYFLRSLFHIMNSENSIRLATSQKSFFCKD